MPRYRIEDPDNGDQELISFDPYTAAETYLKREWNGDSFDHASVRVVDLETKERWTVSCQVTMEPCFNISMVKDPPDVPTKPKKKIRATKLKSRSAASRRDQPRSR